MVYAASVRLLKEWGINWILLLHFAFYEIHHISGVLLLNNLNLFDIRKADVSVRCFQLLLFLWGECCFRWNIHGTSPRKAMSCSGLENRENHPVQQTVVIAISWPTPLRACNWQTRLHRDHSGNRRDISWSSWSMRSSICSRFWQ